MFNLSVIQSIISYDHITVEPRYGNREPISEHIKDNGNDSNTGRSAVTSNAKKGPVDLIVSSIPYGPAHIIKKVINVSS